MALVTAGMLIGMGGIGSDELWAPIPAAATDPSQGLLTTQAFEEQNNTR